MAIIVCGHKNPDADSVLSAIATANLYTNRGFDASAYVQGEITPEVLFVLEKFSLTKPPLLENLADNDLILVDHSDSMLAPKITENNKIIAIIDHHKLGDITTSYPLEMWVMPVGCTSTVLKSMYDFYKIAIPKDIAGAMLCAILSDTIILKSPTTTEQDRTAIEELAKIAGVADYKELGMEMLYVKSAVDHETDKDLVFRDYKEFMMADKKVGIGQIEIIDLKLLSSRKEGLLHEISVLKNNTDCHSVLLILTDIMREGSELLYVSDEPNILEKAFDIVFSDEPVWLEGVMSRKKQVVPNLEKHFVLEINK